MKKIIYIIPGLGENCNVIRYKRLTEALQKDGYTVKHINPDWYRPISEQIFPIEKESVIFGFSMGAVLAYLVAKKYTCKKVIFGSISPIHTFSYNNFVKDLSKHMDRDRAIKIVEDVKKITISLESLNVPFVTLAGKKEKMVADFLVPKSNHRVSKEYINCIRKLLI